jgi:2,3-dihydroxyphenylpropionate 1,2-dioxygenase
LGEIVLAAGTCHAPQLITMPPTEDRGQAERTIEAMRAVAGLIEAHRPDAVVVIANDHIDNFFLTMVPQIGVYVNDRVHGSFGGVERDWACGRDLALALLEGSIEAGFDAAYTQHVILDHAFVVPMHYCLPENPPPVVPLFVNTYLPPQPQPWRCFQWGRRIGEILRARPERVAILASGGLSHYPGTDRYGDPDNAFDRWVLDRLHAGEAHHLTGLSTADLDVHGNVELLTWMVLLGIVGQRRARTLCYEPTWHHGYAVSLFDLGQEVPVDIHYRFSDPAVFPLNRGLYELMRDRSLRQAFVADAASVAERFSLAGEQRDAFVARDRDRLKSLGAHPFLVFMSDFNLRYDTPSPAAR